MRARPKQGSDSSDTRVGIIPEFQAVRDGDKTLANSSGEDCLDAGELTDLMAAKASVQRAVKKGDEKDKLAGEAVGNEVAVPYPFKGFYEVE